MDFFGFLSRVLVLSCSCPPVGSGLDISQSSCEVVRCHASWVTFPGSTSGGLTSLTRATAGREVINSRVMKSRGGWRRRPGLVTVMSIYEVSRDGRVRPYRFGHIRYPGWSSRLDEDSARAVRAVHKYPDAVFFEVLVDGLAMAGPMAIVVRDADAARDKLRPQMD